MDLFGFHITMNLFIIIVTAIISFMSFNNEAMLNRLIFWPAKTSEDRSFYRFITSGFIHADFTHLLFNMFTLYFFGFYVEAVLGGTMYLIFYLIAIAVSQISTYRKYKDNPMYRSLGASGAVSAVLFANIYMAPWEMIYFFGVIPIPAILFAVIYIIYSMRMGKAGNDNINHDAHLYGGIFGFLFMLIFVDKTHGMLFIEALKNIPFLN